MSIWDDLIAELISGRPGLSYAPLESSWAVSSIVAEICQRAGIPFDRIDVSLIEGYCDGFHTTSAYSATSAVDSLADLFLFDPASFDGALHFVPRGLDAVASITSDDMVDEGEIIEQTSRRDSINVPRVMHLEYFDTDGGLTTDKQTSDRTLDNRSTGESSSQTTVIMRADDAARAVVISHKVAIEEQRGEKQFSLPDSWLGLSAADVVLVDGERMRLVDVGIDDGLQKYRALYDRVSAHQTSIQGVPVDQPSTPPSLIASASRIAVIDSHILRSADDALGYYVAVSSIGLDWQGAVVEFSRDGGASWIASEEVITNSIMGVTTATLPEHAVEYPDRVNTLSVELLRDDMELLPATMAEMMNRFNLAIVGDELVNFSDPVQTSDMAWDLSGLLRGRKGSPMSSHAPGERFVLLESSALAFVPAELFDLNRPLTFRVTSFGRTPPDQAVTFTYIGRSQHERQPAYLHARRDGSDIVADWQGVGRLGGGVSIGMGQFFLGYDVWINDVLQPRTFATSGTYTDPGGEVTVTVRQVNSITGLGPAAIGVVPA